MSQPARRRRHWILAGPLLALTLMAACGGPQAPQAGPAQAPAASAAAVPTGTLTISQATIVPVMDPYALTTNSQFSIFYSVWDPLSRVDEEGKLQNYLAESWQNETPTSWIVKLKKGVKWHDGSLFTAKDVVFSTQRLLDPATKSIWTAVYSYVTGAEVVDEYTARIRTKTLVVNVPQDFGRMQMMPKDAFEKAGRDSFIKAPVGTGPFKFVKMAAGDSITLEANMDYHHGPPTVKTLVWKQVPDPATRVAELLAGTSDVVIGLPPNEVTRIGNSPSAKIVAGGSVIRVMLNFAQSTTPALKDARVREAAIRAIDVDAINKAIYDGKAGKQTGWLDKNSFGYNKDLRPHTYDPAKSKQLLSAAGFPNGLPIIFQMRKGDFLLVDEVALAVVDYLKKGGFQVEFQSFENAVFTQMGARGEYKGIYLLASRNSTGDPDQVLRALDPKREDKYVLNKDLEKLIDTQASEPDVTKRAAAVAAVDKYIQDNFLAYNMMTVPSLDGVNNRVSNFKQSPFDVYSVYPLAVK